jgi:hypothetical protein
MICVLEIIEGPARGRRICVNENQCVEIGRLSTSEISIPADTHLSRRHMLLESTRNHFRVHDVGSANGTYVNDRRVTVESIQSGDRVRAGMTTFLVTLCEDDQNPHEKDGIRFGSVNGGLEEVEKSYRTVDFSSSADLESTLLGFELNGPPPAPAPTHAGANDPSPAAAPEKPPPQEAWWNRYFTESSTRFVYEQTATLGVVSSEMASLLERFSPNFHFWLVVNRSHLDASGVSHLQILTSHRRVVPLTGVLCCLEWISDEASRHMVDLCIGRDAIVCVGGRRRIPVLAMQPYLNSLSFPSMFAKHVLDGSGQFLRTFSIEFSIALYEMDEFGRLGLMLRP